MTNIKNLSDCQQLTDNPELYREVISYLLYCRMELLEYADEEDLEDFNFMVLDEEDLPMLDDLGSPEEVVKIDIKMDGIIQTIYRIVYTTEVIFIPTDISDQFSF